MSTKLPGYDGAVLCPYCKDLQLPHRYQKHLVKCEPRHPEIKLETCRFNPTHRFPPEKKAEHIKNCESEASFERYLYFAGSSHGGSGSSSGASHSNQSQSKSLPESNQATKYPKRKSDEEDWTP